MRLCVLTENRTETANLEAEHGLSLYIEACGRKILFDMGQTALFASNAARMGIDLRAVDLAILSHGHYDHGGGIETFLGLNDHAPVYISRHAFAPYYAEENRYIGLQPALQRNDRIVLTGDHLQLAEGLELCSCNDRSRLYPTDSYDLKMVENGVQVPDQFRHEQYLLIREGARRIVVSGCSHKGILNIMAWLQPDVMIGGFHFMDLDPNGPGGAALAQAAEVLNGYTATYYTGHCTGAAQYAFLQTRLGERLHDLTCGRQFEL